MHKKLILTSVLALAVAGPAFATDWPNTNYMQPNSEYTNSANYTHMGVYGGTVNAEAYYTWDGSVVNPGYFWPAATVWNDVPQSFIEAHPTAHTWADYTICPAGSICEGSWNEYWHYDALNPQGIVSCDTATGQSNMFTTEPGAVTVAQCYMSYTNQQSETVTGCDKPTHAETGAAMTGALYYGWGMNTCQIDTTNATANRACQQGYRETHRNAWYDALQGAAAAVDPMNSDTIVYTKNSGATELGSISVHAYCSTMASNTVTDLNNQSQYVAVTDDSSSLNGDALNCYCQAYGFAGGQDLSDYISLSSYGYTDGMTSEYTRFDGFMNLTSSSPFIKIQTYQTQSDCTSSCAAACQSIFTTNASIPVGGPVSGTFYAEDWLKYFDDQPNCEPRRVQIAWSGARTEAVDANDAEFTWYDDAVRTPSTYIGQLGKTFAGWRFIDANHAPVQGTVPADEEEYDSSLEIVGSGYPENNNNNPGD